jgi:hypothetical protein
MMSPPLRGSNPYPCGSLTYRTGYSDFIQYIPIFEICQPDFEIIYAFLLPWHYPPPVLSIGNTLTTTAEKSVYTAVDISGKQL